MKVDQVKHNEMDKSKFIVHNWMNQKESSNNNNNQLTACKGLDSMRLKWQVGHMRPHPTFMLHLQDLDQVIKLSMMIT